MVIRKLFLYALLGCVVSVLVVKMRIRPFSGGHGSLGRVDRQVKQDNYGFQGEIRYLYFISV